jgi:hypothetical protein
LYGKNERSEEKPPPMELAIDSLTTATIIPAWRAARTNVLTALRHP